MALNDNQPYIGSINILPALNIAKIVMENPQHGFNNVDIEKAVDTLDRHEEWFLAYAKIQRGPFH